MHALRDVDERTLSADAVLAMKETRVMRTVSGESFAKCMVGDCDGDNFECATVADGGDSRNQVNKTLLSSSWSSWSSRS